ncbi:MAG: cytidylyltransferase domain-containing protein [bacterium]
MKKVIIVQARMTSTRLPGKVLKEVCGKPLLAHLIARLKRVQNADQIVIATTTNSTDEPIVTLCKQCAMDFYRGSEEDVLSRYYETAKEFSADIIIRITSDCPVIDSKVINKVIAFYMNNKDSCDYVSNVLSRTYPRGMDTEVFSFKVLQEAHREAEDEVEREHVTPFIHQRPERYRCVNVPYDTDQSHHRWTVDTPEDLALITKIFEALFPRKPAFGLEDMLDVMDAHPEWRSINAHVRPKE